MFKRSTHILGGEFSFLVHSSLATHESNEGRHEVEHGVLKDPMFAAMNKLPEESHFTLIHPNYQHYIYKSLVNLTDTREYSGEKVR